MLPTMRWMMFAASLVSLTPMRFNKSGCQKDEMSRIDASPRQRVWVVELYGHCWMAEDLASHQFLNGDSIPMGLKDRRLACSH